MLRLQKPSEAYLKTAMQAALDIKENPTPYDIQEAEYMRDMLLDGKEKEYFQKCEDKSLGKGLPEGYVPATVWWVMEDDTLVGIFDIRHDLNGHLRLVGGHVAYLVVPAHRQKGYAKKGLRLCLDWVRQTLGHEEVLITCNVENEPSFRTMLSALRTWGGYQDTDTKVGDIKQHRVWIKTAD